VPNLVDRAQYERNAMTGAKLPIMVPYPARPRAQSVPNAFEVGLKVRKFAHLGFTLARIHSFERNGPASRL